MKSKQAIFYLALYSLLILIGCKLNEEAAPNTFTNFREGLFVRTLDTLVLSELNKGKGHDVPNVSIIKIIDDTSAIQFVSKIDVSNFKDEIGKINKRLENDPGYAEDLKQKQRLYDMTYRTTPGDSVYFRRSLELAELEYYGRLINDRIDLSMRLTSKTDMYTPDNSSPRTEQFVYYR